MKKLILLPLLSITLAQANGDQPLVNCYDYLIEIIRSSNFPHVYTLNAPVNGMVDSDDGKDITVQLTMEKKSFDLDTPNTHITMGWVRYNIHSKKHI